MRRKNNVTHAVELAAETEAAQELAEARMRSDLFEITDRDIEDDESLAYEPVPPPVFVPARAMAEATVQCEQEFFFDFDQEVSPILEVLIGKTMQLAFAEVTQNQPCSANPLLDCILS